MTSFTWSYIIKLLSYSEAVLWFIESYLYYGSLKVTLEKEKKKKIKINKSYLGEKKSYPDLSLSPQRIKLTFKVNV